MRVRESLSTSRMTISIILARYLEKTVGTTGFLGKHQHRLKLECKAKNAMCVSHLNDVIQ